jgi:predicted transcriptional regulator
MQSSYLLAQEPRAFVPVSPRSRSAAPKLKLHDPAVRAMHDFMRDPPMTVAEDCALQQAIDDLFRLGVRAFLVIRERSVVGLFSVEDAQRRAAQGLRVGDVMTPSQDLPAIDWQTLEDAQIRDLIEIFEGTGVHHLVVVQNQAVNVATVRGLILRERLARQLSSPALLLPGRA